MEIRVEKEPVYNLKLTQTEFLTLFEAIGDRTMDKWDEYQKRYDLTDKQCERLKNIGVGVYDEMDACIAQQFIGEDEDRIMSERWLAQKYKETYKD